MHKVTISPKAKQQLKRLAQRQREDYPLIANALRNLRNYRKIANVRPLANQSNGYRMYVGRFRILFETSAKKVRVLALQEVRRRAT